MGNLTSSSGARRHRNRRDRPPTPPLTHHQTQPEIPANQYVFAAATPYPMHYPNPSPPPQYYQFPGYYPPPTRHPTVPMPIPPPYDHHHHYHQGGWAGGTLPYGAVMPPLPYVEHQKAMTIRNEVNLKKETLRLEPDEDEPGRFLVSFTFDATVAGSITVMFFAKEDAECNLRATKEDVFPPIKVNFQKGLAQMFKQPTGTGIDLSVLPESDLLNENETDVYPLAVKAEVLSSADPNGSEENPVSGTSNCQITHGVFEKEKGVYKVRVMKQILWVNRKRYVLQEIYGIGNAVDDNGVDSSDSSKECVICLSEPRDTTVLPCRHMCMCSGCAKLLRFQTNRCPICRQPVEKLLEIKVNNNGANE